MGGEAGLCLLLVLTDIDLDCLCLPPLSPSISIRLRTAPLLLPREVDRLDMCPVSVSQSEHDGDSLREEMPESLPVELSVW